MDYKKLSTNNNCIYNVGANGTHHFYTKDPYEGTTFLISQLKEDYKNSHPNDKGFVFGFDVEIANKKAATIQLSTDKIGCIFHVVHMHPFPKPLHDLLTDPTIIKSGVGIIGKVLTEGDKYLVRKAFDIETEGIIDVSEIAMKSGLTTQYRGLQELSVELLGDKKAKRSHPGLGWDAQTLPTNMIAYAIHDAYLGYRIAEYLCRDDNFYGWSKDNIITDDDILDQKVNYRDINEIKKEHDPISALMKATGVYKARIQDKKRKFDKIKSKDAEVLNLINEMKYGGSTPTNPEKKKKESSSGDGFSFNFM